MGVSSLAVGDIHALAAFDGIQGCSLVVSESGLVIQAAGEFPDVEYLSEAAVEFWRVYTRQHEYFEALGKLNLIMMAFQKGWLAVTWCASDPTLLLVAVARSQSVDWPGWLRRARMSAPPERPEATN
ncbi:hypothetical protein SAMN05216350_105220 [Polaromonas sp. YR568]|nr:hypothetical protein SAMN05216350_105220 [Polaromonas sp. YR568]